MLKTIAVTTLVILAVLALPAAYLHEEIGYAISAIEAKEKAQKKMESLPTKEDIVKAIKEKSTNTLNDEAIVEGVGAIEEATKRKIANARSALKQKIDKASESEIAIKLKTDENTKPLALKVERDIRNLVAGVNEQVEITSEAKSSEENDKEIDSLSIDSDIEIEKKWSLSGLKDKLSNSTVGSLKEHKDASEEVAQSDTDEASDDDCEEGDECYKKWSWAAIKKKVSGN